MEDAAARPAELSDEDVNIIFSSIEQLIPIHEEIGRKLSSNVPTGKVFHESATDLLQYAHYVARLADANSR